MAICKLTFKQIMLCMTLCLQEYNGEDPVEYFATVRALAHWLGNVAAPEGGRRVRQGEHASQHIFGQKKGPNRWSFSVVRQLVHSDAHALLTLCTPHCKFDRI